MGFQQLGTIVVNENFSAVHLKINKIKDIILEAMDKVYVIDSI